MDLCPVLHFFEPTANSRPGGIKYLRDIGLFRQIRYSEWVFDMISFKSRLELKLNTGKSQDPIGCKMKICLRRRFFCACGNLFELLPWTTTSCSMQIFLFPTCNAGTTRTNAEAVLHFASKLSVSPKTVSTLQHQIHGPSLEVQDHGLRVIWDK